MIKILNPKNRVAYFEEKIGIEVERKLLDIDYKDIYKKLESLPLIEVFSGTVISEYWYGNPDNIYIPIELYKKALDRRNQKPIHWVRLRQMKYEDGFTIYFTGTKYDSLTKPDGKDEIEEIINLELMDEIRRRYGKNKNIELREREIKKRKIYTFESKSNGLPKRGIEYNLYHIISPVIIPPFLEIEAINKRRCNKAIKEMKLDDREFTKMTTRELIQMYQVTEETDDLNRGL